MVNFGRNAPPITLGLASLIFWASFGWALPAEPPAAEGDADPVIGEGPWTCDSCGTANEASAKYCTECGTKKAGEAGAGELSARNVCKQCGFEAEGDAKFCPICGQRLKAAAEDPWAAAKLSAAYGYAECPRCGEKNEIRAERCSRCAFELPQPSAEMTDPDMVFVPGKGYYREGTLLEPAKTKKTYKVTGLILGGAGVVMSVGAGAGFLPGYVNQIFGIVGLPLTFVGIGLLIHGLVGGTEPVYASAGGEAYEPYDRAACALMSPYSDTVTFEVEFTLLAF